MCIWTALIKLGVIKIKNQKSSLEDGRRMGKRDWGELESGSNRWLWLKHVSIYRTFK